MSILETLSHYIIIGFGLTVGGLLGFGFFTLVLYSCDKFTSMVKIKGFLNNDSSDKFKSN
jgi:hypothetical protein